MKAGTLVLCIVTISLILSACAAQPATPDLAATITAQAMTLESLNQPTSAQTVLPPSAPPPTVVKTSTPIRTPTEIPYPVPGILEQILLNPKIRAVETFDNWTKQGWNSSDNVSVVNDDGGKSVKLPGKTVFATWLVSPSFPNSNGILARFKLSGTGVEFFLVQNQWDTPAYKRFGSAIYGGERMETTIWEGSDNRLSNQALNGSLIFTSDVWYGLFIGADQNGNFHFVAWDWDNPKQLVWHEFAGGSAWATGEWWFDVQVDEGTVYLDDFSIISFDAFKSTSSGIATSTGAVNSSSSCKPTVTVSKETNCRTGPGIPYPSVGSLLVGETAIIVGRHAPGGYWIINNPDESGTCWLWDEYATVSGETSCLPVIVPPPSPTPEPKYHPYLACIPTNPLIGSGVATIDGYGFQPGVGVNVRFMIYVNNVLVNDKTSGPYYPDANGYLNLFGVNCLNLQDQKYVAEAYINGAFISTCTVTCTWP